MVIAFHISHLALSKRIGHRYVVHTSASPSRRPGSGGRQVMTTSASHLIVNLHVRKIINLRGGQGRASTATSRLLDVYPDWCA